MRKLVIDKVKMDDAGTIIAKTNADETSCQFEVKRKNAYVHSIIYIFEYLGAYIFITWISYVKDFLFLIRCR